MGEVQWRNHGWLVDCHSLKAEKGPSQERNLTAGLLKLMNRRKYGSPTHCQIDQCTLR